MKKSTNKFYILLTTIATTLWFLGSWWHYSCNIKKTCYSEAANPTTAIHSPNPGNTSENSISATNQVIDTDTDGLSDKEEQQLGTDSLLIDTDGDSIPDNEEIGASVSSPLDTDADGIIDALDKDDDNDGIPTAIEEKIGTSALRQDTDDDGISDLKEIGGKENDPTDTDNDGIINALDADDDDDSISTANEILLGTNYLLLDTDGDGLSDAQEVGKNLDNPIDTDKDGVIDALDTEEETDKDGDGLSDSLEAKLNTDPSKADTDGDGISDLQEVGKNVDNPLDSDLDGIIDAIDAIDDTDTDGDTISDVKERKLGSNPEKADSDNDGINDNEEIGKNLSSPLDTDADGIFNIIDKDDDNDNLSTRYEIRIGTNPLSDDSDNDGLKDNIEAKDPITQKLQDTDHDELINPVDPDDDNDGIPTSIEISFSTNPLDNDSDADGISDSVEYGNNHNNPLDSDGNGVINALQSNKQLVSAESINKSDNKNKADMADNEDTADKESIDVTDIKDDVKNKVAVKVTAKTDEKETKETKETKKIKDAQDNDDKKVNTSKDGKDNEKSRGLNLEYLDSRNTESGIKAARMYFPFLSAKPEFSDEVANYISDVAKWMNKDPNNTVTLTGHTDNIGSKQSNLALGIKRVMVIREFLLDKGAPMSQIDILSRGESEPIQDNKTEQGRLLNRRVEILPMLQIQN